MPDHDATCTRCPPTRGHPRRRPGSPWSTSGRGQRGDVRGDAPGVREAGGERAVGDRDAAPRAGSIMRSWWNTAGAATIQRSRSSSTGRRSNPRWTTGRRGGKPIPRSVTSCTRTGWRPRRRRSGSHVPAVPARAVDRSAGRGVDAPRDVAARSKEGDLVTAPTWSSRSTGRSRRIAPRSWAARSTETPHLFVVGCLGESGPGDDTYRIDVQEVEATIREACRRWNVLEVTADPYAGPAAAGPRWTSRSPSRSSRSRPRG